MAHEQRFSSLQMMQTWSSTVSVTRGASSKSRERIIASDEDALTNEVRRVL